MFIKMGKYSFKNDVDCKLTMDGWEIFAEAVKRLNITPISIRTVYGRSVTAQWSFGGGIMVEWD